MEVRTKAPLSKAPNTIPKSKAGEGTPTLYRKRGRFDPHHRKGCTEKEEERERRGAKEGKRGAEGTRGEREAAQHGRQGHATEAAKKSLSSGPALPGERRRTARAFSLCSIRPKLWCKCDAAVD